jgi:2-polyprenyl-3-methyl-5-hydroxy-6-metoxy-1,4-benzoquinol methylase
MEPHAFVAEVYRRMSLRHAHDAAPKSLPEMLKDARVLQAEREYVHLLPPERSAAILDIGFGGGWFLAACIKLGYTNLSGADFGVAYKAHIRNWSPAIAAVEEIESNVGDFLASRRESYDFIHMSHVIEHIPKYSLLYVGDALYWSLKPGGTLLLRTPNMEGPCSNSSLYVTLAHEYGFAGSNLRSLLDICGFDDIRFHSPATYYRSAKQRAGELMRWPILKWNAARHRLFGVNFGGQFGPELVVSARRGSQEPLFDARYK